MSYVIVRAAMVCAECNTLTSGAKSRRVKFGIIQLKGGIGMSENTSVKSRRFGVQEISLCILSLAVVYVVVRSSMTEAVKAEPPVVHVANESPVVNVCVTNSLPQLEIGMPSLSCSVTNVMPLTDGMQPVVEEGGIVKDEKEESFLYIFIFSVVKQEIDFGSFGRFPARKDNLNISLESGGI